MAGPYPTGSQPFNDRSSQSNLTSFSQPTGLFGQPTSWATSVQSYILCHSCKATDYFRSKINVGLSVKDDFCPLFNLVSGSQVRGKSVLSPPGRAVLTHSAADQGGQHGFSPLSTIGEHAMSSQLKLKEDRNGFHLKALLFQSGLFFPEAHQIWAAALRGRKHVFRPVHLIYFPELCLTERDFSWRSARKEGLCLCLSPFISFVIFFYVFSLGCKIRFHTI